MEVKTIEKTKNKVVLEIKGGEHTLFNALKEEMYNDGDVKASGYFIEHPENGILRLIVETSKKDPVKVILDAVKRTTKKNDKFIEAFNKEIK